MTEVMAAVNISMFEEVLVGRLPDIHDYKQAIDLLLTKPKQFALRDPDGVTRYMVFDHVTFVELDRTDHPGTGGLIGMSAMKVKANIMGGGVLEGDLRGKHSKESVDKFFSEDQPTFELVKKGTENSVIINRDHCVFVELQGSIIKG